MALPSTAVNCQTRGRHSKHYDPKWTKLRREKVWKVCFNSYCYCCGSSVIQLGLYRIGHKPYINWHSLWPIWTYPIQHSCGLLKWLKWFSSYSSKYCADVAMDRSQQSVKMGW